MSGITTTRVLFDSPAMTLGVFTCRAEDPAWVRRSAAAWPFIAVGTGGTAVRLWREGMEPAIGMCSGAAMYAADEPYSVQLLACRPERTFFVRTDPHLVREVAAMLGLSSREDARSPFPYRHAACAGVVYRELHYAAAAAERGDTLGAEASLTGCVCGLIKGEQRRRTVAAERRAPRVSPAARDYVRWTQELLAQRFRERLSLAQIAGRIGVSPFHLCHAFKAITGQTIHASRDQLRLRAALAALPEQDCPLVTIADDHGYASQSHFSDAFRRQFGVSPGRARATMRTGGAHASFRKTPQN